MKHKRMACVIDDKTVLERVFCPVCGARHYIEYMSDLYFCNDDVPDAGEIVCDDCFSGASFFFGSAFVEGLAAYDEQDVIRFLAGVARLIQRDITARGSMLSSVGRFIENHLFSDGSRVRYLAGQWELLPSLQRLKYSLRPVCMGGVKA